MIYNIAGLIWIAIGIALLGYAVLRSVLDKPDHTRKDGGRDWRNF